MFVIDLEDNSPAAVAARQGAVDAFREFAAQSRLTDLLGAAAVQSVKRSQAHRAEGCASLSEFAERNGISAYAVRQLEDMGRALEADPALAEVVRCGTVPVASAAVLGQVAAAPVEVRQAANWSELARTQTTQQFRRLFLRCRDEVRAGEPLSPVTAYVKRSVREDMSHARDLVSRTAHVAKTLGETCEVVFSDWLDEHDPQRKEPGTRRLPDTSTIPGQRYVPAEVDRHVRARTNDRCIVPYCDNSKWLDRSHRIAHAQGGCREAYNLDLLCDLHHVMYERGLIRITGSAEAPVITDRGGWPLHLRRSHVLGEKPEQRNGNGASSGDPPGATSGASPGAVSEAVCNRLQRLPRWTHVCVGAGPRGRADPPVLRRPPGPQHAQEFPEAGASPPSNFVSGLRLDPSGDGASRLRAVSRSRGRGPSSPSCRGGRSAPWL